MNQEKEQTEAQAAARCYVAFELDGAAMHSIGGVGIPFEAVVGYLPAGAKNIRLLTPEEIAERFAQEAEEA